VKLLRRPDKSGSPHVDAWPPSPRSIKRWPIAFHVIFDLDLAALS